MLFFLSEYVKSGGHRWKIWTELSTETISERETLLSKLSWNMYILRFSAQFGPGGV